MHYANEHPPAGSYYDPRDRIYINIDPRVRDAADDLFDGMLGWSGNHAVQSAYINGKTEDDGILDALETAYKVAATHLGRSDTDRINREASIYMHTTEWIW